MIEEQTKKLAITISKLYRRGAERNIRNIIAKSREADIASILEELDTEERLAVFNIVPGVERKADIVSHLREEFQKELAHVLSSDELQEILSEMNADDAADFLGHLPDELSKEIIKGMSSEDIQEVEGLLGYPEDSAGGLMTSEVLIMNDNTTVSEAIQQIQVSEDDIISFYIYVVSENHQLVGVLSLKQLLLQKPATQIQDIMERDVISVDVNTPQDNVAKIVEKYDFLALPVVDHSKNLVGVITVDDIIDVIREEASEEFLTRGMAGSLDNQSFLAHFRSRFPWFLLAIAFGVLSFISLYLGLPKEEVHWELICTIPLAMFVVTLLSNQTATLSVSRLRSKTKAWKQFVTNEVLLGLSLGVLLSVVGVLAVTLLPFALKNYYVFALSSLVLALSTVLTSLGIPVLLHRINGEVGGEAIPLATIFSNILSIFIFVLFSYL